MTIRPRDEGVVFVTDAGPVPALFENVSATRLATVISEGAAEVRTVEHLMAAFSAAGVFAAEVTVEGPELPIMDGSARPFLDAITRVLAPGAGPQPLKVKRAVVASEGAAFAALLPH
ncbi:MAG: UDP-3-O-acyl-N-acetylglucosamine deacetylase, partial [Pseudomonadota bacterium]